MNLTLEKLELIKGYGELKYPPRQICKLMGFFGDTAIAFLFEIQEEGSQIKEYYEMGLALGDYDIDKKLHDSAKTADVPAITELNNRQYRAKINDLKHELFGI